MKNAGSEMLMKGRSPTRIEMHEDFDYVVFDIWSTKQNRFLHYNKVYQTCYHFDIPVVDLYGTCKDVYKRQIHYRLCAHGREVGR